VGRHTARSEGQVVVAAEVTGAEGTDVVVPVDPVAGLAVYHEREPPSHWPLGRGKTWPGRSLVLCPQPSTRLACRMCSQLPSTSSKHGSPRGHNTSRHM
jgi:hypothetical protein